MTAATAPADPAPARLGPMLRGASGVVVAAHHEAATAGARIFDAGGNAADAVIAAQAVICVLMPQAASVGGDLLALVRSPDGVVHGINGTGASARSATPGNWSTGGASVTTPGLVGGWGALHGHARLPLATDLAPAIALARDGVIPDAALTAAVHAQRTRLNTGGAEVWPLLAVTAGQRWRQPALADLLVMVAEDGPDAFYTGASADAVAAAVRRHGGELDRADLEEHRTVLAPPVVVPWAGGLAYVQPPTSQGVLLAMALAHLERAAEDLAALGDGELAHLLIELTEATFAHRSDCAEPERLLSLRLGVDRERAGHRGGPRGYLHTAGVATADADGLVVSSLISVFDDFGSGVYVPELGCTLNNRAAGFTDGANAPAPGVRPVHTLAPCLLAGRVGPGAGSVLALSTPGADGQVQTLLQVLVGLRYRGLSLPAAVAALRWRTEDDSVLVEAGHAAASTLTRKGHALLPRPAGDPVFGGVTAAGVDTEGPFGVADERRSVAGAVA